MNGNDKRLNTIDPSSVDFGEVELKISQFSIHVSKESLKLNHQLSRGVKISEGESFTLICSVIGDPIPRIFWYHNNQLVDRQWFRYTNHDDTNNRNTSELKFQFANANLTGNYTCHAENPHGHVTKSVFVKVIQTPSTTQQIETKSTTNILQNNNGNSCEFDVDCTPGRCLTSIDTTSKKVKNYCQCPIPLSGLHCENRMDLDNIVTKPTIPNIHSSILTNPCETSCKSAITNVIIMSGLGSVLMVLILFLIFTLYFSRKKMSNTSDIPNCNSKQIKAFKNCESDRFLIEKPIENICMENLLTSQDNLAPYYYLNRNLDKTNHDSCMKHMNIYSLEQASTNFNPHVQTTNFFDNSMKSNNLDTPNSELSTKSITNSHCHEKLSSFSVVQNLFVNN